MSDGGVKGPSTTAGSTCLLLVGDRVVLRATAPPEAEYALFEIGEIELRASEPGRVREHGYQTTAAQARARLASLGFTPSLARDVALTMQPVLSDAYARGTAVRRVARYLGPSELFQAETYDGATHTYRGVFLDLSALSRDLELDNAAVTLHALYLATVLESEADETTILLSTDACTKSGKPGARTYRRPAFADAQRLVNAIGALATLAPQPDVEEALPRADVIAFLRTRADSAADEDARALYKSLESSVSLRDMPERGPLAASDLWAIETRLESGEFEGIADAIDDAERRHGRTPGTTYLRARVALALRLEPPKLIAEKVSALALSLTSFQELGLLAAEAWLDAGDPRRAMPYARDLVDAAGVDEGLLLRAQRLLARAVGAAPQKRAETLVDSVQAPQPSRSPSIPVPHLSAMAASEMTAALDPGLHPGLHELDIDDLLEAEPPVPRPPILSPLPPPVPPPLRVPPPIPSSRPAAARSAPPGGRRAPPSFGPDIPDLPPRARLPAPSPVPLLADREPTPMRASGAQAGPFGGGSDRPPSGSTPLAIPHLDATASFTLDLPGPDPITPPESPTSSPPRRARLSGVMMETRPPNSYDPRAEPDSPIIPRQGTPRAATPTGDTRASAPGPKGARRRASSPAAEQARPARTSSAERRRDEPTLPPAAPAPASADPSSGSSSSEEAARSYMHGASLPPFRLESPAPLLPRAPLFPKLGGAADELAEHLALPPGLGAEPRSLEVLPTSILEARVQFTLLARELGLDYRLKRGLDLRADVSGIEAMQSVLLESFPEHAAKTSDDAYELRRHGALLSEILARRLEAEWLDISPNELGYWVMIVPPDTRVWPFGRVARLVAMGHKERDLVSYFLELQTRARGR